MTQPPRRNAKKKISPTLLSGGLALLFTLFFLLLFLKNSALSQEAVRRGISLCLESLIPSLFPCMVLSEILLSLIEGQQEIARLLTPVGRFLGLTPLGTTALLLGLLSGFPIGARAACHLYDKGQIGRTEAERILRYGTIPSSGFLIGTVGSGLYRDIRFGITLYLTLLFSTLFVARLEKSIKKYKPTPPPLASACLHSSPVRFSRIFTNAVTGAANGGLLVSAYVLFFSALGSALDAVLGSGNLSGEGRAFLFCLLELSSGMQLTATLPSRLLGTVLAAFAAGWSGISVHCQLLSLTDGRGFSMGAYLLSKLAVGVLSAIILGLFLPLIPYAG